MNLYSDEELAEILNQDIFHQISEAADRLGLECYVVGGYVRDIFLERPSNDIDVVVVGSGIKVAEELKRIVGKKAHLSVFKNFGTAQVKFGRRVPNTRWSLWELVRRATVTTPVNLLSKTERWRTIRTVATLLSMPWPSA